MAKIIGNALPNIPWQDKPQGYDKPVWRYDHNPIIPRDPHFQQHLQLRSCPV